jgi:hypothetical protein
VAAWLCNSTSKVSDSLPSSEDEMPLSYAAHDLAALSALSDHITGAGAYFAACDASRCLLCMIHIRTVGIIACSSSSLSRPWVLVDAAQCKCLQHGTVLEQICTELATCS